MIPIRDTIPSRNYPVINTALILINVIVYAIEISQGEALDVFLFTYGLVPGRYSIHEIASYFSISQQILSFASFMFLHGSFWHLLGNMWFLYIFGDNIEDRLGHLKYLLFYLLCGVSSGITHLFFNLGSMMPTVGASGAIAGVMGAYFILYPRAKIITLIPIIFIPYFVELPAMAFLGIWFFMQFISASLSTAQSGGIAWWAHIGGFIFGMIFLKLFLLIPEGGITRKLSKITARKTTPRLQMTRPIPETGDADLYSDIFITPEEAAHGVRKLVSIPLGYQKKPIALNIPPGIKNGTKIRLAGLGKKIDDNHRGDLYLTVIVEDY